MQYAGSRFPCVLWEMYTKMNVCNPISDLASSKSLDTTQSDVLLLNDKALIYLDNSIHSS